MITSDEYEDEIETDTADVIPATVCVLMPGGAATRRRQPLWTITHPALPRHITVNPRAPLTLTTAELAALRQGFDSCPVLGYPLAAAFADQGLPYAEAELISDAWQDMAHGRGSARMWGAEA